MTEKFRVELKSLVNTCNDVWAGICPRAYTKTVEAESEMEAIEKAKTQVVAEALSRGYDEEVTITKVEKLADIKAQVQNGTYEVKPKEIAEALSRTIQPNKGEK